MDTNQMLKVWGKEFYWGFGKSFIHLIPREFSINRLEMKGPLKKISQSRIVFRESAEYRPSEDFTKKGMVSQKWLKPNQESPVNALNLRSPASCCA